MSTKSIIKKIRELLWIARCPDTDCDNEGTVDEHNGSCHQCHWCYERDLVCRHIYSAIDMDKDKDDKDIVFRLFMASDACAECGFNLRNKIHKREGE